MDPLDILDIKNNRLILKTSVLNKIREANKTRFILPLDSRNFAKVLKGGFCLNNKYLIYGANRTGKTQICLSLCVQAYKYFIKQEKNN